MKYLTVKRRNLTQETDVSSTSAKVYYNKCFFVTHYTANRNNISTESSTSSLLIEIVSKRCKANWLSDYIKLNAMVYINMKIHLHHECKSLYNVERKKTKQKTKTRYEFINRCNMNKTHHVSGAR